MTAHNKMKTVQSYPEAIAALALRLCVGYFLFVWGVSKLVIPGQTRALFNYFYGINFGASVPYLLGAAEIAIAFGIVVGLWRRVSYGLGLVIHSITIVVSAKFWLHPLLLEDGVPINRMYVAAVPTLAAFLALFLLRDYDRWSVDAWLARGSSSAGTPSRE